MKGTNGIFKYVLHITPSIHTIFLNTAKRGTQ